MTTTTPLFNRATAQHCVPYPFDNLKHKHDGRTVSYHQPGASADTVDLFGRNEQFIATVTAISANNNFTTPNPRDDAHAAHRAYLALTPAERIAFDAHLLEEYKAKRKAAAASIAAANAAGINVSGIDVSGGVDPGSDNAPASTRPATT